MAVITSDEPYNYSWSAPGPPKNANEQAAQGMMQAGIGSLSGNKYDGAASMMTTSPAGNNYYHPNFNTISSNLTNKIRMKNDDISSVMYGISDFVNPNTGNAMSLSSAYTDSLPFARMVYPDGSGFEERNGEEYPIQLKGPQTWRINPGNNKGIQAALNNKYKLMNAKEKGDNPLMNELFRLNRERRMEELRRRMMEENLRLQMEWSNEMLMNPNKFNLTPGTGDLNPIFGGDPYWNI